LKRKPQRTFEKKTTNYSSENRLEQKHEKQNIIAKFTVFIHSYRMNYVVTIKDICIRKLMGKKNDVVKINSLTEVIIDGKLELEHVF